MTEDTHDCTDCGRAHDPDIRCPNYHAGMAPTSRPPLEDDLVERAIKHLRRFNDFNLQQAANALEAQQRKIEGLTLSLRRIADLRQHSREDDGENAEWMEREARKALDDGGEK